MRSSEWFASKKPLSAKPKIASAVAAKPCRLRELETKKARIVKSSKHMMSNVRIRFRHGSDERLPNCLRPNVTLATDAECLKNFDRCPHRAACPRSWWFQASSVAPPIVAMNRSP